MSDTKPTSGAERRARPRTLVAVELKLEAPQQRVIMVSRTVDLSSTGAFIRTNRTLPVGAPVHVAFPRGADMNPLSLDAEVVRTGLADGGRMTGVAIRFVDMTELDETILDELITRAKN